MIKKIFILGLILSYAACVKKANNPDITDDYVLVEFAARLEEEQYQIYPEPLENYKKKSP